MGWEIINKLADIADLRVDESVTDSRFVDETELRLELRTASSEIELDEDARVFAGFTRMTLSLVCHGTEVAVGERHGDYTPPNDIVTKITSDTNTSVKAGAKAGLNLNAATGLTGMPLSASVSGEASHATVEKSKTAKTSTSKHVTAKPNDKWEISSLDHKVPLSAKYLTAENTLCIIKPKAKANRSGVEVHLSAHKGDLVVTSPDEKKSRFALINTEKKNKERVFTILLGKIMANSPGSAAQNSTISLSEISSLNPDDQ